MSGPPTVVFDLGGVLIEWNPRHLYRQLIPDEEDMERFLAEVCTTEWHQRHDAGRSFAEGVAELVDRHPEHRELIEAWHHRFDEMVPGSLPDTVAVLEDVVALGEPVYALTNWSAEAWPMAVERFDFLELFAGIVVSGHEGVIKPDRAIFERLLARYGLEPAETVFIDDWDRNVDGARAAGLRGIQFEDAAQLRRELRARGLGV